MAYCPECKGEMSVTAAECPHCGHDFPPTESMVAGQREGFEYSPFADLALMVSMIATVIGICGTVTLTIVSLSTGQLLNGLFVGPIASLVLLGILVVFLRVQ